MGGRERVPESPPRHPFKEGPLVLLSEYGFGV